MSGQRRAAAAAVGEAVAVGCGGWLADPGTSWLLARSRHAPLACREGQEARHLQGVTLELRLGTLDCVRCSLCVRIRTGW